MPEYALLPHPSTPCPFIGAVQATVEPLPNGRLRCSYEVTGDIDGLDTPPPAAPIRTDGLWRRTCFELFLRSTHGEDYDELNFSPSGAWAAYRFTGHRSGMTPMAMDSPPTIRCQQHPGGLTLDAVIHTPEHRRAPLRIALSAVLQQRDGALTYWALHHPPGAPDFHHDAGFTAMLECIAPASTR
ncbi:MAG: DOMON-like domain-containing protein [Nevskiaceae bacterium]|jgi:hypothetical protein|nr:DOMON-like domain-containing protein [Nevskiaceae bacterium]